MKKKSFSNLKVGSIVAWKDYFDAKMNYGTLVKKIRVGEPAHIETYTFYGTLLEGKKTISVNRHKVRKATKEEIIKYTLLKFQMHE